MSVKTKQGHYGPVMLDVAGTSLTDVEKKQINHPLVGGVILFTRNFQTVQQLMDLVAQLRQQKSNLLISVDHEGGRVQRFKSGFTRLPAAKVYGKLFQQDELQAKKLTEQAGWLMATELLACGIDFSFAPVLDIDIGISQVIGDRAFSSEPGEALILARAFRQGMRMAGMAAVGKHFPGHGSVVQDSHIGFPVDNRDFQTIAECDLLPFAGLIEDGLEAIMPAHVIYPRLDDKPAGFSNFWLQQLLRQQMGFQGVIFSDDLSMEAASVEGSAEMRAEAALKAGCDMVLVCNQPAKANDVLRHLSELSFKDEASSQRLSRMVGTKKLDWAECSVSPDYRLAKGNIEALMES